MFKITKITYQYILQKFSRWTNTKLQKITYQYILLTTIISIYTIHILQKKIKIQEHKFYFLPQHPNWAHILISSPFSFFSCPQHPNWAPKSFFPHPKLKLIALASSTMQNDAFLCRKRQKNIPVGRTAG